MKVLFRKILISTSAVLLSVFLIAAFETLSLLRQGYSFTVGGVVNKIVSVSQPAYSDSVFSRQVIDNIYLDINKEQGGSFMLVFVKKGLFLYRGIGNFIGDYTVMKNGTPVGVSVGEIGDRKSVLSVAVLRELPGGIDVSQYKPSAIFHSGNKDYTVLVWQIGEDVPRSFLRDYPIVSNP